MALIKHFTPPKYSILSSVNATSKHEIKIADSRSPLSDAAVAALNKTDIVLFGKPPPEKNLTLIFF